MSVTTVSVGAGLLPDEVNSLSMVSAVSAMAFITPVESLLLFFFSPNSIDLIPVYSCSPSGRFFVTEHDVKNIAKA